VFETLNDPGATRQQQWSPLVRTTIRFGGDASDQTHNGGASQFVPEPTKGAKHTRQGAKRYVQLNATASSACPRHLSLKPRIV